MKSSLLLVLSLVSEGYETAYNIHEHFYSFFFIGKRIVDIFLVNDIDYGLAEYQYFSIENRGTCY